MQISTMISCKMWASADKCKSNSFIGSVSLKDFLSCVYKDVSSCVSGRKTGPRDEAQED